MKAIILSHERGGSHIMDREGNFRFVRGYSARQIGTEIELKPQSVVYNTKIAVIAACLVLLTLLFGSFSRFWDAGRYLVYIDNRPGIEDIVLKNYQNYPKNGGQCANIYISGSYHQNILS